MDHSDISPYSDEELSQEWQRMIDSHPDGNASPKLASGCYQIDKLAYEGSIKRTRKDDDFSETLHLLPQAVFTSKNFTSVKVDYQNQGIPQLNIHLDEDGKKAFAVITTELAGDQSRLAFVINNILYSAPVVLEPIIGGQLSISGGFTDKEAHALRAILEKEMNEE